MAEDALAVGRPPDPVETELKLSAVGPAPLRRLALLPALGDTPLGMPQTFLELDRYLDTQDGRLAKARWACRLRNRSGTYVVSLKGPAVSASQLDGAVHRRPEIEGPASAVADPGAWPDSAARDRLIELTGGRPLREQFTLRQTRTQRPVGGAKQLVGTLSLDRVLVVRDGAPASRLWCVELELASSAEARVPDRAANESLSRLLADLVAVGGLTVEPMTKLERALALLARAGS